MRYLAVFIVVLLVLSSACLSVKYETQTPSMTPSSSIPDHLGNSSAGTSSTPVETQTKDEVSVGSSNFTVNETSSPPGPSGGENLSIQSVRSWACWLQNASPEVIAESGFDLIVMDYSRDGSDATAYTREEIEEIKRAGVIPVAYISIGEAEDYRFYWNGSWKENPPDWLGPENPDWRGNYAVKYWDVEWKEIVFRYLEGIIAQGFMGVYLDKVDEYWFWAEQGYNENWTAEQMIEFILEIANYTRSKAGQNFIIIPQNGEYLLEYDNGTLLATVSGWASEDVFYNGLEPSPWMAEKVPLLDRVVEAGKPVFVIDYVDDGSGSEENLARILDFIEKVRRAGFIPYVAFEDRELDRLDIIPGIQPPT